ncbi:MAG: radical SAM protein, partial [Anaerolineae bacterium]|nr:radical SAM protein [Anaerolineae bacterium]
MRVLPLETEIIYGPIRSRRLGLSLGLNILPTHCKVCSFDCIYCHYGRTHVKTLIPDPALFPGADTVLQAIERALHTHPQIDSLTFSGNGEPTLHPYFPRIAREARRLRDRLAPQARLSLFSNATTAHQPHIRDTLTLIDASIMKLDAGDDETLARIDRPVPGVHLETLLNALRDVPRLIIQSVLIGGPVTNVAGPAFTAWIDALATLHPWQVQVYSTDYPVPEESIEWIPPYRLQQL